jgi:uncharacterized protein YndB with AHSA1/START domain
VVREVLIDATPETVFEFFTDPEKMVRWKGSAAILDPTPGGAYRVEVNEGSTVAGEYVELDPPHRVVFTWGWENATGPVVPGSSTVEVTLAPEGEGTRLTLVHRDLPEGEQEQHAVGWDYFIPRLQEAAAGRDPGPQAHLT